MHELLNFLTLQKEEFERLDPDRAANGAWPTKAETLHNLRLNRAYFPNDGDRLDSSFAATWKQCRINGFVIQGRCNPRCHAKHLIITPVGRKMLIEWNEKGCRRCKCDAQHRLEEVKIVADVV